MSVDLLGDMLSGLGALFPEATDLGCFGKDKSISSSLNLAVHLSGK